MDNLEDYVDYGVVFSLSILTVSLSYFVELTNPLTWPILILLPIQLGFIAEISKAGFQKASLLAIPSLFFAFLGGVTAFVAIVTVIMSILVSFFAGGRRFKDFYASTALPLLLTGLMIGGASYYMISSDESIESEVEENIVEFTTTLSNMMLEEALQEPEEQQMQQEETIESSAESMVMLTESYIINETSEELGPEETQLVLGAFESARDEIPQEAVDQQNQYMEEGDLTNYEEHIESMLNQLIEPKYYLAVIPFAALVFYSLQPVVGILTGIFALLFYRTRTN